MSRLTESWKTVKLGEVCNRVCSGGTPRSTNSQFYDNGTIPWLNTKEIHSNRIWGTEKKITEEGLRASSAKWIRENTVIVAMYGATAGNVAQTRIPLTTNQACCNLEVNGDVAFSDYIFYYLLNSYDKLTLLANGAAQQNLNAQTIKEFPISLPPLPTQRKIAAVLGAIDDKIENNRKICANLEAQAQALFKSWFVDFEPFGGKMPEGWKMGKLGDYCETVLGGTPSRAESSYWGGNIAWINSGKVNDFRIIEASEYITKEGLEQSAAKMMPAKTVVVAITGATLGQVSLLEIESSANQSVIGILENDDMPYEFVYPLITSKISDLIKCQTGGAQQHINKNDVNDLQFIKPDVTTIDEYKNNVAANYQLIAEACFESRALAELRDALLPRLMSGEIDVSEVAV